VRISPGQLFGLRWKVKGEILMEQEKTDKKTTSAKSTLTTIVKFNTVICAIFAATWALTSLLHPHPNLLAGLSSIGFILGSLVTISALNTRLRAELEEPDSAE
jgi:hypothetical protein